MNFFKVQHTSSVAETMPMAVILTLAGGFLDAYTYLLRGGVFANAQTGNIVLVGVGIASANWSSVVTHTLPVLAFVTGILVSSYIKDYFPKDHPLLTWQSFILIFELTALLLVGLIPAKTQYNGLVNITVSFITAMQYGAFKTVNGSSYATTMCTGMLRSATESLYGCIASPQNRRIKFVQSMRYYAIIAVFCAGCFLGAVCSDRLGVKAVWVSAGLMLCAVILFMHDLFKAKRTGTNNHI